MMWHTKPPDDRYPLTLKPPVAGFRLRAAVLIVVLVLALLSAAGLAGSRKKVTLTVDGKTIPISTFHPTVQEILNQEHIILNPQDAVIPPADTRLKDGLQIRVVRAIPVTITVDGQIRKVLTRAPTVAQLLQEEHLLLNKEDIVNPAPSTPLKPGTAIEIVRVKREIQEKTSSFLLR